MSFVRLLVASAVLAASPAVLFAGGSERWIADFDKAVAAAREAKKDLLVDFTGSDWCGWCKRLDAEVFSKDEFLKGVDAKYVLVSLDFPKADAVKAKVPNPKRNEELQAKYGISGFPTILLMTPDGDVIGRTGYKEGGPTAYVKHLEDLHASGKKVIDEGIAIVRRYEASTGADREKLLDETLERLTQTESDSPLIGKLAGIAKDAFKLDPENKAGRKERACNALLFAGQVDADIEKAVNEIDPKNARGLFEKLVDARCARITSQDQLKGALQWIEELDGMGMKDKEIQQRLYVNAVFWNHRFLDDLAAAKKWAAKVKALGIDDENLKNMIEQVLAS